MNLTAKQYIEEKSYRNSVFVVKGITSGMYIDIDGIFERDIEQAQAFANYEDATTYIKGSRYPSLLKPVKYVPTATDTDTGLESEDENPDEFSLPRWKLEDKAEANRH